MSEPLFDPLTALRTLLERGVRFVLIGGYAGALRGSPVITGDVDICYVLESKVRTCVAGVPAPVGPGNKVAECWPAMRTPRVSSAVMIGG